MEFTSSAGVVNCVSSYAISSKHDVEDQFDIESWSSSSDMKSPLTYIFEDDESLKEEYSTWPWILLSRSSSLVSNRGKSSVDGSSVDPIEEASLVLSEDQVEKKDLKKEEHVLTWLLNSSSMDDYKQIERDLFQSDFPSPSFNIKSSGEIESSHSIVQPHSKFEDVSQVTDLDDVDTNGPLFWPFQYQFSKVTESSPQHLFSISPCRNIIMESETWEKVWRPKSVALKFNERRKDGKGKKFSGVPSRLSITSQDSARKIPSVENKNDYVKEPNKKQNTAVSDYMGLIEEDFEAPIEVLVGLNEFDGHEGVGSEFSEDSFLLELSCLINPTCE